MDSMPFLFPYFSLVPGIFVVVVRRAFKRCLLGLPCSSGFFIFI